MKHIIQQWTARRAIRLVMALSLMLGVPAAFATATAAPALASGSYNNADIATDGLSHLGEVPAPGGGQCKAFANAMVNTASGGTQSPSGYQTGWANAGGTEETSANAAKGDIIQITPAGSTDSTAESLYNYSDKSKRLHTAIIVSNNGSDSFTVVDANFVPANGLTVAQHTFDPYTWAAGSIVKIWRMGTASGSSNNSGTTSDSRPAAVVRDSSHMEAFYRDINGNLQDMGWDANYGWVISQRASHVSGNPVAVSRTSSTMNVFYRDTSNNLQQMGWDASIGWSSGTLISNGSVTGDPAVIARDSSDLDVFYRSNARGLVHVHWNATSGWAGAENVVTNGTVAGYPVAVTRNSGQFDVFYRDTSNNLVSVGWSATGGWYSGGTLISNGSVTVDPAVIAPDASDLEVFYRSNGAGLVHVHWNATSGWAGAANLVTGGTVAGAPGAVVRDSGHLDVFYRDTSGNLEDVGWDVNSGWTAPGIRAANINDNPSAIARTSSNMDVFYGGSVGGLWDMGWDASIGWMQTGLGGSPA